MTVVHDTASTGFSRNTDRFNRARPTYHPDIVGRVVNRFGSGTLVELGAGTGIFTRQLVDLGQPVIAIEPVYSMRDALSRSVPEADIRVGSAEQIPLDENTVDTVVASQSFHWFDHERALEEIYRVLRPGGHLVTVWNIRQETTRWAAELSKIIDTYRNGAPRPSDMVWRRAINSHARFGAIDEFRVDNPIETTPWGVVERTLSISFISSLPEAKQEKIAESVRQLVKGEGDSFVFPYQSQLQAWRALPPSG